LPSTLPSYIYTFVALAAISTILVATLHSYTMSLEATAEIEQLENLINHVAAVGSELLTIVATTNSSARVFVQLPTTIGNRQYWLGARNDTSRAWLEGSLGQAMIREATAYVFLPQRTSASGYFVSGYGPAILEACMNGSTPQLNLSSLGG